MARIILLTGFEPFGGERSNPSWEVASRLDGHTYKGWKIAALRLPVNCRRAARAFVAAIERDRPGAVLGLGQAGGRPALSLEKVAINLADERPRREVDGGLNGKPIVPGGPDAYFSRLPAPAILRAITKNGIPAGLSLTAGVYVCNTVMYAGLHALRRRRTAPAGFIHLPYAATQAVRNRGMASMSLEMMTCGIDIALTVISRRL
jgi:pyroglutamyl-peptidase